MNDFMSQPRFQIPSLKKLRRLKLIKRLQASANSEVLQLLRFAALKGLRDRYQQELSAQPPEIEQLWQKHHDEALAFYRSILSNPQATDAEKLLAQERIDSLLGL